MGFENTPSDDPSDLETAVNANAAAGNRLTDLTANLLAERAAPMGGPLAVRGAISAGGSHQRVGGICSKHTTNASAGAEAAFRLYPPTTDPWFVIDETSSGTTHGILQQFTDASALICGSTLSASQYGAFFNEIDAVSIRNNTTLTSTGTFQNAYALRGYIRNLSIIGGTIRNSNAASEQPCFRVYGLLGGEAYDVTFAGPQLYLGGGSSDGEINHLPFHHFTFTGCTFTIDRAGMSGGSFPSALKLYGDTKWVTFVSCYFTLAGYSPTANWRIGDVYPNTKGIRFYNCFFSTDGGTSWTVINQNHFRMNGSNTVPQSHQVACSPLIPLGLPSGAIVP